MARKSTAKRAGRKNVAGAKETRGNGDELEELGSDYLWRAPDGSEVLACCQVLDCRISR